MAKGAWAKALIPPLAAAGAEIDTDPYKLFDESGGIAPYDPAVMQALNDGRKVR